ncbi:MAG: hypothetical protein GY794_04095 [bacterium]|nr:hypothetical protein [bacterium]
MKHIYSPDTSCHLWVLCIVAVFACAIWTSQTNAAGMTHRYNDIHIVALDIPSSAGSQHGYVAYRFSVANRSQKTNHTVQLHLPYETYGSANVTAAKTVVVAPGTVTIVSLLQPPLSMSGENVKVEIDGKVRKRQIPFSPVEHGTGEYWNSGVCILATKSLSRNMEDAREGILNNLSPEPEISIETSDLYVSRWAENWLAYSHYDAVVVSNDELSAMPPAVRDAIMRYVACGGTLLVSGSFDVPKSWKDRHYQHASLNHYNVGFGTCVIAPKNLMTIRTRQWVSLYQSWASGADSQKVTHDTSEANNTFPIVENLRVPTGGLLAVMLIFVILTGPVNMMVLSKFRKRIWLFWTVPAISLLTCISVFLYAFIAEGWDGHARTASFTILDQRNHQASTIGWAAFYSPMTPGDGLHFGLETEITPQWGQGKDHHSHYGPSEIDRRGELHLDWTSDQHLLGNWLSARVPTHFAIRKGETRRERLSVTVANDGSITVVNGLGAKIKKLYLADASGRIHEASDIAPGARAVLTGRSGDRHVTTEYSSGRSLRTMTQSIPPYSPQCTANRFIQSLRPNCYVADLDGAPFVENALDGAQQTKSRSVVYGIWGDNGGS